MPAADDIPAVHHYNSYDEMPAEIQKYWQQRHDLFSLYDSGIRLTDSAWYGVTPEPIATRIATHLASLPESIDTVIDLFAGAGGNTIALALSGRFKSVFGIEADAATLACAEHNAEVYGVRNRITFVHGDCFQVLKRRFKGLLGRAVVFGSPPWGGVGYGEHQVFDLRGMQPYGLQELMGLAKGARAACWYLPRSSDLNQIARWKADEGIEGRIRAVHYCMNGHSKVSGMSIQEGRC